MTKINHDKWGDKVNWNKPEVVCPACRGFLRHPNVQAETKMCMCDTIGGSARSTSGDNSEAYKKKLRAYEEGKRWAEDKTVYEIPKYTPPQKPVIRLKQRIINAVKYISI